MPASATVQALLEQAAEPRVSLAQIRDGRIAQTAAYGVQNDKVAATPGTLYNIASLTKPISTEIAALEL